MNKKNFIIIIISLILLQGIKSEIFATGECGAQFLKMGVGARAASLGESYVSISNDPTALYWNPSGIAQIDKYSLHVMQNFWLLDMSYQFLGIVAPFKFGSIGAAASFSHSGTMEKYEEFEKVGEYKAYDLALQISYAREVIDSLFVGFTLKGIHQVIEEEDAQALAVDFGILYKVPLVDGLKFGLSIHNLGKGIKFISEEDPLPQIGRLGISYFRKFFMVTADLTKNRDSDFKGNFGTEFDLKKIVFFRAGYNTAKSFSLGSGFKVWKCAVDYAFEFHKDIDNAHYISLEFEF